MDSEDLRLAKEKLDIRKIIHDYKSGTITIEFEGKPILDIVSPRVDKKYFQIPPGYFDLTQRVENLERQIESIYTTREVSDEHAYNLIVDFLKSLPVNEKEFDIIHIQQELDLPLGQINNVLNKLLSEGKIKDV